MLIQKNIAVPFSYYEEHRCLKTASLLFVLVILVTNKLKVQPIVSRAGNFKDSLWGCNARQASGFTRDFSRPVREKKFRAKIEGKCSFYAMFCES